MNFESAIGRKIIDVDAAFSYYFKHLGSWLYFWRDTYSTDSDASLYAREVDSEAQDITLSANPLAKTRFGAPIAVSMRLQAVRYAVKGYRYPSPEDIEQHVVKESGLIFWLPPTLEMSDYEAVNIILRERYGLLLEESPPSWTEAFKLPRQVSVEEEIGRSEEELQRVQNELAAAQQRLREERRFQRLLYDHGEALEVVVRDAFRELGATVTDPNTPSEEDGRLQDPSNRQAILEIKGLMRSLKLDNVRELQDWVSKAIAEEDWTGKGILVANTYRGDPIGERGVPFPNNCIRTAQRFNQCLITTTQLFRALIEHQRGKLDTGEFWDTVFSTSGVCPLPELEVEGL